MTSYRSIPRGYGKAVAFYDETLRLWRQLHAPAPLACHPDDHARHLVGLTEAAERAYDADPIDLLADSRCPRGVIVCYGGSP